ncbi:hypothetical protein RQP46_001003 [Phenoliferia psychrophenolica]
MPPQLPPEVLGLILAEVGAHWVAYDSRHSDAVCARDQLSRCCRVSKVFLGVSQRILYSVILLQFNPSGNPAFAQTSRSIIQSLARARRPTLAQHARSLVIDVSTSYEDYATDLDDNLVPLAVLYALRLSPGVRHIHLDFNFTDHTNYADSILESIADAAPLLRSLTVRSTWEVDAFRPSAVATLLRALPLLESLEMDPPFEIEDLQRPTFSLTSLSLGRTKLLPADPLPFLTASRSNKTLTHIHIHTSRDSTLCHLSPFVSLLSVSITCHSFEQDYDILDSLRAPLLESVTIAVRDPYVCVGEEDSQTRLLKTGVLEKIPKLAKFVHVAAYIDPAYLASFVATSSDLGWQQLELLRTQNVQDGFLDTCEAQGIEVKFNQLPPEVLALILAEVGASWLAYDSRRHWEGLRARDQLSRCCHVSKDFLDLSRRILYGVILLQFNTTGGLVFVQAPESTAQSFALARRPTLAQHARSLVIDLSTSEDDTALDDHLVPLAVLHALRLAPGVRHLYLNYDFRDLNSYADLILETIAETSPPLRSLKIRSSSDVDAFRPTAVATLLRALPLLESLELDPPFGIEDLQHPTFSIKSLVLGRAMLVRSDPLPFLTAHSHENLTHIHIHNSRSSSPHDLSPFTSLLSVTITCNVGEQDYDILDTLRAPLLQNVTIEVRDTYVRVGAENYRVRLLKTGVLEKIPKLAKVVHLAAFVAPAYLASFVADASDLGWRQLELLVTQNVQDGFLDTCKAQGIEVKFNQM